MPIDITNKEEKQIALTGAEIEETLIQAHLSKDAIAKIEGLEASASKIDVSVLSCNNPDMYGAVGDGVADDTDALNLALLTKDVKLTMGKTYRVGRLNISSNTTVDLNGATLLRNTESLPGGVNNWDNDVFMIYIKDGNYVENITIKNGTINDMHTESVLYRGFFGVSTLGKVSGIHFDKLTFLDSHSGLYIIPSAAIPAISDSSFTKCKFLNPNIISVGTGITNTRQIPYALVALTNSENVTVDKCYMEYSYHGAITLPDDSSTFGNNNITFKNNVVKNTVDTSLYYYGQNSTMTNNYVENPGKDGIKINLTKLSQSYDNTIENNMLVGSPAQHQHDGSGMIVSVGKANKIINNTIKMVGTTQFGVAPFCIIVDGENSKVLGNTIYANGGNTYKGLNLYSFALSSYARKGIIVSGNSFDCSGQNISVVQDSQTHFSIVDNYFKTNSVSIGFNFTNTQPSVRIPVFAKICNNTFYAENITAQHIYNAYVDRVSFSNNSFTGSGQRDLQAASNTGSFIGVGNTSEALNDPVWISLVAKNRGTNHTVVPTSGTYKKGEIIGGDSLGYRCTQSGTLGTITGVTASTTAGSPNIIVNIDKIIYPGMYITIAGESGIFTVKSNSGLNITLTTNVVNTASSVSIQYSPAVFTAGSEYYV